MHTLVIKVLEDADLRVLNRCFHLPTAEVDDCKKYDYEDQQAYADPDDHQERLVLLLSSLITGDNFDSLAIGDLSTARFLTSAALKSQFKAIRADCTSLLIYA